MCSFSRAKGVYVCVCVCVCERLLTGAQRAGVKRALDLLGGDADLAPDTANELHGSVLGSLTTQRKQTLGTSAMGPSSESTEPQVHPCTAMLLMRG